MNASHFSKTRHKRKKVCNRNRERERFLQRLVSCLGESKDRQIVLTSSRYNDVSTRNQDVGLWAAKVAKAGTPIYSPFSNGRRGSWYIVVDGDTPAVQCRPAELLMARPAGAINCDWDNNAIIGLIWN